MTTDPTPVASAETAALRQGCAAADSTWRGNVHHAAYVPGSVMALGSIVYAGLPDKKSLLFLRSSVLNVLFSW